MLQHLLFLTTMQLFASGTSNTESNTQFPVGAKSVSGYTWMEEMRRSLIYLALFTTTNPLVGFAVYFGLWHSLSTIVEDVRYLKANGCKWFRFNNQDAKNQSVSVTLKDLLVCYMLAVPYTLVSIVSMALFYTYSDLILPHIQGPFVVSSNSTLETTDSLGDSPVNSDTDLISHAVVQLWAVFVMSIAVLTGPHIWVVAAKHYIESISLDPFGLLAH